MVGGVECLICFLKNSICPLKRESGKKEGENERQEGNFAKSGKKIHCLGSSILIWFSGMTWLTWITKDC